MMGVPLERIEGRIEMEGVTNECLLAKGLAKREKDRVDDLKITLVQIQRRLDRIELALEQVRMCLVDWEG